jgi:hypothetical protein
VLGFRSDDLAVASAGDLAPGYSLAGAELLSHPLQFVCTLATTTTDSLASANNYTYTNAVPLSNYSGLALATGDRGAAVTAQDDWFRLDNAKVGSTYEIQTLPDKTTNYNLGLIVYYSDGLVEVMRNADPADNNFASITFKPANFGPYFFRIYQLTPQCTGETYRLVVSVTTPTATPELGEDPYEPNDSQAAAYFLPVATSASAVDANFYPPGDEDWFAFYVKSGRLYRASTSNLLGVDTFLEVFDRNGTRLGGDNDGGGGFASRFEWTASYEGYYYVRVTNRVTSSSNDTYDLAVSEISPGATETPAPFPTSRPGLDECENNFNLDTACVIAPGQPQTFNFISPFLHGPDNDFYRLWIKQGLIYECRTSNLSPGVDPNLIVYDQNRNPLGGNDDVAPGNFNSTFTVYANYSGWLYLLLGTGDRTPSDVFNSNYTLECSVTVPGSGTTTPTPAPGTPRPTNTPCPPGAVAPPPGGTATPLPGLTVRALTTPTPLVARTPAPAYIPITVLVYYDGNGDRQPGAGEGVSGVSVQAYQATTDRLLAQGFTDDQGYLEFTVSSEGLVRVAVPFFGFSQLVGGRGASLYVRVPPQPSLGGAR